MDLHWLDWAAVGVLGAVVGASELISRYKDHPGAAIKTVDSIIPKIPADILSILGR